jgi:hypothetical protein
MVDRYLRRPGFAPPDCSDERERVEQPPPSTVPSARLPSRDEMGCVRYGRHVYDSFRLCPGLDETTSKCGGLVVRGDSGDGGM